MNALFGELTPVLVLAMITALVQFIKTQLNWKGKRVIWLSFGIGLFFGALVILTELVPVTALWVRYLVYALLFGLVASGFYDLTNKKKDEPQPVTYNPNPSTINIMPLTDRLKPPQG